MKTLYGLFGEKLGHSLSPAIHSLVLKEFNIEGYYHLFELQEYELKDAIKGLKILGAKGVNVTIPHKMPVMKHLDEISDKARKIGSVNTICFENNKTIGHNTDYDGFGMMLDTNHIETINKTALILGSGGSATGILHYLMDNGIKGVFLVSRDTEKTKEFYNMDDVNFISYDDINHINYTDIVINCTPCGMYPNIDASPLEKNIMHKFGTAIDLIYNPKETLFLKYARESGAKTVNGLYMLVGQAVRAQEIWNNITVSKNIVDKIYECVLD